MRVLDFLIDLDRVNHRMHNKLMIADNAVAIVGGRNIGNHYFDVATDANFREIRQTTSNPDSWTPAVVLVLAAATGSISAWAHQPTSTSQDLLKEIIQDVVGCIIEVARGKVTPNSGIDPMQRGAMPVLERVFQHGDDDGGRDLDVSKSVPASPGSGHQGVRYPIFFRLHPVYIQPRTF